MNKIIKTGSLTSAVLATLLLTGCGGSNYRCDSEDIAFQAMSLRLYKKIDREYITDIQKYGFEPQELGLLRINKNEETSICSVRFTNKYAKQAFDKLKAEVMEKQNIDEFEAESKIHPIAVIPNAFILWFEKQYGREFDRKKDFAGKDAKIFEYIFLNGGSKFTYRTYDNGDGAIIIELE